MKKKMGALVILVAFSLSIPLVTHVLAKGHVAAHKEQACHAGVVITISANALDAHLDHGDCFIDKATHVPGLFSGDVCDASDCSQPPG